MKRLFLIFCYLSAASTPSYASDFGEIIYSCIGFSDESTIQPLDTQVVVLKRDTDFFARIKIGYSDQFMVPIKRKHVDEVSFYDLFFNRARKIEIQVFLDDLGSMSSLQVNAQKYDLTCGQF